MKRIKVFFFIFLLLLVSLVACDKKPVEGELISLNNNSSLNNENDNDQILEEGLKEPIIEWWDLYNPNGYVTFTAGIINPNDIAIDVSYDLVFYKEGVEVRRAKELANNTIASKQKDLIWTNYDVPNSEEVDEVKLENVQVKEAFNKPLTGKYEYLRTEDNMAYFAFEFDPELSFAYINFVLYNDNNHNQKCDKDEIVAVEMCSLDEPNGEVSFPIDIYNYTDYKVYYIAY